MSFMPGFLGTPKALKSVTLFAQATSTAQTIVVPAGVIAGDILVLLDRPGNSSGTPANITPAGFTQIRTDIDSIGTSRRSFSYKLADGSEGGATLTGANGTAANVKVLAVIRGDKPVASASVNGVVSSGITNNDPPAQTVACGSGTPPMLALATYYSSGSISVRSLSVGGIEAKDGETPTADLRAYIAWKLLTAAHDVVIDMNDDGNNNCLQGAYLALII